jgi:1,4-alpha-glucan branching enzyme
LLRDLNRAIYADFGDVQTYAEESTAWPMVSRPTYLGGLGFGFKWDMGWMHDTLLYLSRDPIHRRFHHNELTFRAIYAGSENYVLPLSHDEVVHGKGALAAKMPGDAWQQLANLRLLYAYQWALPAKKLLFMGGEIGQWHEWNHEGSVEWHLYDDPMHAGVARLVADLNRLVANEPALYEQDTDGHGFQWAVPDDADNSTLAFFRYAQDGSPLLFVGNFTPVPRYNFRTPVPTGGTWREVLNSDGADYSGSGVGNYGGVEAQPMPMREHSWSLTLTLPPLGALFLRPEKPSAE